MGTRVADVSSGGIPGTGGDVDRYLDALFHRPMRYTVVIVE